MWIRLLSQNIAQRANTEDGEVGKFRQARYRSVRLLDETAVLACAAYVGLNPITVAMAQTIEDSDFTSAQKRVRDLEARHRNGSAASFASPETVDGVTSEVGDLQDSAGGDGAGGPDRGGTASHLAPVELPERCDTPGPDPNREGSRCSNKGFLAMSTAEYLTLPDWTGRQPRADESGSTPHPFAPLFERLGISAETWCQPVRNSGHLFRVVAGKPTSMDSHCSRSGSHHYRTKRTARELMAKA